MALDLSPIRLIDPVIDINIRYLSNMMINEVANNGLLSLPWQDWLTQLSFFLADYLTSVGIIIPEITSVQQAQIVPSSKIYMVYISDTGLLQVRINNVWKTFTLT